VSAKSRYWVLHFREVIGQIIFYKAFARCGSGIGSRAALVNGELPAVHLDANQQAVVNFRFAAKEAFERELGKLRQDTLDGGNKQVNVCTRIRRHIAKPPTTRN
jgi:hypothetical protein